MEYVALILVCGLFADNMITRDKLKNLAERIKDLEDSTMER